jgi:hypothetical protein
MLVLLAWTSWFCRRIKEVCEIHVLFKISRFFPTIKLTRFRTTIGNGHRAIRRKCLFDGWDVKWTTTPSKILWPGFSRVYWDSWVFITVHRPPFLRVKLSGVNTKFRRHNHTTCLCTGACNGESLISLYHISALSVYSLDPCLINYHK